MPLKTGHLKKKRLLDIYPFYNVISSKSAKIGAVWQVDKGMMKCYSVPLRRGMHEGVTYIHNPAIFTVLDTGEDGWYAIHVLGETRIDWINVLKDKHMFEAVTLIKIA